MTGIINYGVTSILCAAGAAVWLSVIMSKAVVPVATALAQELTALISSALAGKDPTTPALWKAQGVAMATFLYGFLLGKQLDLYVDTLAESLTGATAETVAEDEFPVAGSIMFGLSLAPGAANLIETSTEVVV